MKQIGDPLQNSSGWEWFQQYLSFDWKEKSTTYNFQDDWHISSCPGSTLKKRTLNGHFPRLAQTDPYVFRNCLVNSRPRPPHHHHHHHYDHFRNRHPYTIMYLGTAWSTPAEQSNSPTLG